MRNYVILPSDAVMTAINGLYVCPDGSVYGTDAKGIYKIKPYLNTNGGSAKWRYGYYKFCYKGIRIVHTLVAKAFVPGYKPGLVVDHINNDSRDNRAENLQWISRGENTEKFWASLSEADLKRYKEKYSEGLKKAHKAGKYNEHLKNLHK